MSTTEYNCSLCGMKEVAPSKRVPSNIASLMVSEHMCFHCAYWKDKILNPDPHFEVIDGCYYKIGDNLPLIKYQNNHFGELSYIVHPNGTVCVYNNLLPSGKIPDHFLKYFPETGKFIIKRVFNFLEKYSDLKCVSKGCYDRYHCVWYSANENKDGPWNIVPKNNAKESNQTKKIQTRRVRNTKRQNPSYKRRYRIRNYRRKRHNRRRNEAI